MGKDNLNIIRKWKISKIYLETKIERQKWRNVRNKIVKIKGVELKSPLNIKFVIKLCVGGGGANEKKKTTVSNKSHFMIKNNKPLQNKGGRV
jgi:hypothetical protein